MVETLAIVPQAYLPKFGVQFNLFSCVYTQAGSLTIAKWSKFGVYTYPLIILCPGKLLLPALQSEMDWMLTLSQPRQGNQRVLSPGRWYTSIKLLQMSGLDDPRCRHNRESHCKITPRPDGGVSNLFYTSVSSLVSVPIPLSRHDMVGCSDLSPLFFSTLEFIPFSLRWF